MKEPGRVDSSLGCSPSFCTLPRPTCLEMLLPMGGSGTLYNNQQSVTDMATNQSVKGSSSFKVASPQVTQDFVKLTKI